MTFAVYLHTTFIVNILFKTSIFPIKGKKNNQSSVSDADQEIPSLGSMDNAGNSDNPIQSIFRPRSQHFPFTLGMGFLGLHRRLMIDSIYPSCAKTE